MRKDNINYVASIEYTRIGWDWEVCWHHIEMRKYDDFLEEIEKVLKGEHTMYPPIPAISEPQLWFAYHHENEITDKVIKDLKLDDSKYKGE